MEDQVWNSSSRLKKLMFWTMLSI